MANNTVKKQAVQGSVERSEQAASERDMELINGYARRKMSCDEVYVFSVVLCDNDIDRDGERFTVESLFELEKLFVGKTGIFDHDPSAKNQRARIFECAVEAVAGRKTALGDDYFCLKARAYMPKSEKNSELILALDSGIVKEVSVGCAVTNTLCSICGEPISLCSHQKGEQYGSRLCCGELIKPYDAYEWSFVAVPAQRQAGVTKTCEIKGKVITIEEILKKLELGANTSLGEEECRRLAEYINELKKSAKDGVFYRDTLKADIVRLSAAIQPDISRDTVESIAKSMTVAQLREVKTAYEKMRAKSLELTPQLYREKKQETAENGQFKI